MKLQIRVGEDGIISDVKFKTFGCGSAIASSSYITERVKGMHLDEAGKVKNTEIAKELCLPPVKREYKSEERGLVAEICPWWDLCRGALVLQTRGGRYRCDPVAGDSAASVSKCKRVSTGTRAVLGSTWRAALHRRASPLCPHVPALGSVTEATGSALGAFHACSSFHVHARLLTLAVHCSLLAEDAIKSAIKDYQKKRELRLAAAAVSRTRTPLTGTDLPQAAQTSAPEPQAAHA